MEFKIKDKTLAKELEQFHSLEAEIYHDVNKVQSSKEWDLQLDQYEIIDERNFRMYLKLKNKNKIL